MMALGPTLIGALVGASAGVVVHVLLETKTNLGELPWFAVVTGLTTGLGVRFLNGQQEMSRASFLRAGIAAAVALAAIVLAPQLKAMVVQQQGPSGVAEVAVVAQNADTEEEATDESVPGEDAPPQRPEIPIGTPGTSGIGGIPVQGKFDTWQFIFMAVGALLAYEFARGKDAKPASPSAEAPPKEEDEVEPGDAESGNV